MSAGVLEAWRRALSDDGLQCHDVPGELGFRIAFAGRMGRWMCFAKVDARRGIASFYSLAPLMVPPRRRTEMMDLITRANFGLPLGCFELSVDDGDLRLRTSLKFGVIQPPTQLLLGLVWPSLAAMDKYLPAIVAVAQKGMAGAEALALVERPVSRPSTSVDRADGLHALTTSAEREPHR